MGEHGGCLVELWARFVCHACLLVWHDIVFVFSFCSSMNV